MSRIERGSPAYNEPAELSEQSQDGAFAPAAVTGDPSAAMPGIVSEAGEDEHALLSRAAAPQGRRSLFRR